MPKKTLGNIEGRPRRKTFLLAYRKKLRLTQQQAADKIGVCYTTVGRKERGANVDQAYLQAAAEAYGCKPENFFEPPPWLTEASPAPGLAEIRSVFAHVLSGLDSKGHPRQPALPERETPAPPEPTTPPGGSKSKKKSARRKRP